MRRVSVLCAIAATAIVPTPAATAEPVSNAEVLEALTRLQTQVESLQRLREKDRERLAGLERRLEASEAGRGGPESVWDAGAFSAGPEPGGGLGQGNLLNPGISAFVDAGGSLSSDGDNKAYNRFNLREAELDFRGAITPYADGVVIVALGEEIETTAEGKIDALSTAVEVEEAYINFHTLPHDLAVKTGQFRTAFGPNNRLHTHDLPQVTRPLAVESFLGPEGLLSQGVSTQWLVPNPWDQYIEWTGEVLNSSGGGESPILSDPNADNPAVLTHVKWFGDVGETGAVELGGSYLFGHTGDGGSEQANVFGVDAMFQWLDPAAPDSRSLLFQGELFWAENDNLTDTPDVTMENSSFGAYAFGQYQWAPNWYAGVRVDYTEFPNNALRGRDDRDWAVSPYVSWYLSEFLRLRFEWQHRAFEVADRWDDEDNFFLQLTWAIGAHPPHPYWVNR